MVCLSFWVPYKGAKTTMKLPNMNQPQKKRKEERNPWQPIEIKSHLMAAAEAAAVVAEKEPTPTACIISTYKLV